VKQKLPFILEIVWLTIMVLSLAAAIHKTIKFNFTDSIALYVIAALCALVYAFRRYMRKLREKTQSPK